MRYKSHSHRLQLLIPVILVSIWPVFEPSEAMAQSNGNILTASRGSNQLGATLRRTVQRSGLYASRRSFTSGSATQRGFVNSSADRGNPYTSQGRRQGLGGGVYFQGTQNTRGVNATSLMRFFGRSPSAVFFSPPTFVGLEQTSRTRAPRFETGTIDAEISRREESAYFNAFSHSVAFSLQQRALRDEETNDSLLNMPEITEDSVSVAANRPSHAEQLQRKVDSIRKKQTEKAWELLREGQYHQSHKAFQRAGIGAEEDIAPAIGEFVSAVVDRQYRSAMVQLQSMIRHNPDMFSVRRPLSEVLPSARDGDRVLSECAAVVTNNPESAEFAAIQAYLLWLDGDTPAKESSAIRAATQLRDNFRATEYAGFLEKMQEAIDAAVSSELAQDDKVG